MLVFHVFIECRNCLHTIKIIIISTDLKIEPNFSYGLTPPGVSCCSEEASFTWFYYIFTVRTNIFYRFTQSLKEPIFMTDTNIKDEVFFGWQN